MIYFFAFLILVCLAMTYLTLIGFFILGYYIGMGMARRHDAERIEEYRRLWLEVNSIHRLDRKELETFKQDRARAETLLKRELKNRV